MNGSTKRGRIAALILLCSVLSAAADAPVPRISGDEVLALAAELSGPLYEGRGIGTEGGRRAAGLLEGMLRKAGYRVQFQDFPERPGFNRGEAGLEAVLPGGARQTFVYRKDFRETARGGWTGGDRGRPPAPPGSPGAGVPRRLRPADPRLPLRSRRLGFLRRPGSRS